MAYSIADNDIVAIWDALSLSVKYLGHAIEGDVVEFGTASGQSAIVIAATLGYMRRHTNYNDTMHGIGPRKLHLFDSFQGFPEMPNPIDSNAPHVVAKVWRPGSMRMLTADQLPRSVRRNI
jgi:hypothetical protein